MCVCVCTCVCSCDYHWGREKEGLWWRENGEPKIWRREVGILQRNVISKFSFAPPAEHGSERVTMDTGAAGDGERQLYCRMGCGCEVEPTASPVSWRRALC